MILKRRNVEIEAVDIDKIRELKAAGFEPISGEDPVIETPKSLDDLSVKELKAIAKERGITVSSALRKADIIEMLRDSND